jgi:hypothetical protein
MLTAELQFLKQLGSGIVGFTAFVVLSLGAWIWSSAASAPETLTAYDAHTGLRSSDGRSIASIPEPSTASSDEFSNPSDSAAKMDAKIETVTLASCLRGGNQKLQTTARHVRLKVVGCHNTNVDASQLVNIANGYQGTLFNLEKGGVSSDYIHLVDGENRLELNLQDTKGHKVASEVTIFRHSGS